MTTATGSPARKGASPALKRGVGIGAIVILVIAMALDTTVVPDGTDVSQGPEQFSQEKYGQTTFPKIQRAVEQRAAPADVLAKAIADDKDAAAKKYGVPGTIGPIMAVKFTGTLGKGDSGIYDVKVDGVPQDLDIHLQTGPAITGTTLRDSVDNISFGDFKNQIEYQNAAAGINNAMKKALLTDLDRDHLTGKQVTVVGAFLLLSPNNWMVTPVRLSVSS